MRGQDFAVFYAGAGCSPTWFHMLTGRRKIFEHALTKVRL